MPTYTIETTFQLPHYRRQNFTAETVELACDLAVRDSDWSCGIPDFDTAGETYVTGVWEGADADHSGPDLSFPEAFGESLHRKAILFDDLVALLREPARPMGISQQDFETWLPRAIAALAKADAIGRDMAAMCSRTP